MSPEERHARKAQQRRLVHREADAIDRILEILDGVASYSSWLGVRRVLMYVLLHKWVALSKAIVLSEIDQ